MRKLRSKRRVLITGGTGSVGVALCEAFAKIGDEVTLQFRSQTKVAKRMALRYGTKLLQMDFEQTTRLPSGHFDILINNAGINEVRCITHDVSACDWERAIWINLTVPFLLAKQCLPGMKRKGWGRIINISSIYGFKGVEERAAYTASKHGLAGLTKTIAREYAAYGITCNEICPGPIESEMMNRIAREQSSNKRAIDRYFEEVCEEIPLERMAKPNEIAECALFLASWKAAYVTGVSIPFDGGMTA